MHFMPVSDSGEGNPCDWRVWSGFYSLDSMYAESNCSSLRRMIIFYTALKHSQGNGGAKILGLGCLRMKKECGEISRKRKVDEVEGDRKIRRASERTIDMKPCSLPESNEKILSIYTFFTLTPEVKCMKWL